MKVQRDKVTLYKDHVQSNDEYVSWPSHECISFVWELTQEIYTFTGEFDAESRLQRDIVHVTRK